MSRFSAAFVVSRSRRFGLVAAVVLTAALPGPPDALAAEISWRTDNFSYMARDKPLDEFIREFAAHENLNVSIDPEVEGTVNGKFDLTPPSMLELLTTSFGLMWYYDGRVLHVYPTGEMSSAVIRLETVTVTKLNAALRDLGILDDRYPISHDSKSNTAFVSGPVQYVELVQETVRAIDRDRPVQGVADIRVFPLRYAWAADHRFSQDGREQRLPGVASVLRQLYGDGSASEGPPAATRPAKDDDSTELDELRRFGLIRARESSRTGPAADEMREAWVEQPSSAKSTGSRGLPQFQADGRMNAVIVRDRPERMPFYEAVIHSLDVKPGLVEIEARILEISSDAIDSLGIDWRLHGGEVDFQFSRGNLPNLGFDTALSERAPRDTPLPPGAGRRGGLDRVPGVGVAPPVPLPDLQRGGVLTTVLGDSGRYLIARVNALAQDGKANILASPRVLTLDNVEAVLENIDTFFVRVAGNLDVQLFDVSAGTSLRVTPLIVTENGNQQVKLAIRIEDGVISSRTVDQIPVVRRSTIGTQAFIKEGESLLIGGYESRSQRDTEVGVPGLSSIPLLGRLFKYREKQSSQVQRLFMLTPRVVEP